MFDVDRLSRISPHAAFCTIALLLAFLSGGCSDKKPTDPEPKPPIKTWSRTYMDLVGESTVILETENGYLVVGGYGYRTPGQYLFAEVDTDGNLLWYKTYGPWGEDYIYDVVKTPYGYLAAGISDPTLTEAYKLWLVAVDRSGNLLWEKRSGFGYTVFWVRSIVESGDGG